MSLTTFRALLAAGAAVVVAVAVAAGASGSASVAQYRFVESPIAVYSRASNGEPIYEIFVRLNRQVPRTASGSPLGGATLEGFGPDLPRSSNDDGWGFTTLGSRSRRCYSQSLIDFLVPGADLPQRLEDPRPGRRVAARVYVRGAHRPLSRTVRLERRRSGSAQPYTRRLGCQRMP